jgi:hypothetical protein
VVAPNFRGSDYANQEIGFAMGRGIPVIPLKLPNSELPGFVKSSQAIITPQENLDDAVAKIIQTAEDKLKDSYVRPTSVSSLAELIDSRLEQRREPYWRVLVRPQTQYGFIPKSSESDKWFSQSPVRPEILTYMDAKPTPQGWSFVSNTGRIAEVLASGDFCYGRPFRSNEPAYIQTAIRILGWSIQYELTVYQSFKLNPQQQQVGVVAELKLGRCRGLKLEIEEAPSPWGETHTTDQNEVVEEKSLPLSEWLKDFRTPIESMIVQFCRSFEISLEDSTAKKLVSSVFP